MVYKWWWMRAQVKLWDVTGDKPSLVAAQDMKVGPRTPRSCPCGSEALRGWHTASIMACSHALGALTMLLTMHRTHLRQPWRLDERIFYNLVILSFVQVGAAFTAAFCQEAPWLLAAGGAAGTVAVWDVLTSGPVASRYGKHFAKCRSS